VNGNAGRNIAAWVIIGILLVAVYNFFVSSDMNVAQTQAYSDFLADVDSGKVTDAVVKGQVVSAQMSGGQKVSIYMPEGGDAVSRMIEKGVRVRALPDDSGQPTLMGILISVLPMLIILGLWVFFMRQAQAGNGKAMGFGKSRARLLNEGTGRITFEDVAGIDEAKQELLEIVEFLKEPQKFQKLGGKIPKGVLLVGAPGTGKTLLARAIAGEANVPFFSISGSDFVEMFVGVGASRVRDMFEQAKKHAPCLVFIDEIDAVGRHRGAGLGGGNDEREQTLNQLLVEMDGFASNEGVILIAATNRPDVLDPALMRPGRFDRQVVVPMPDIAGREKILKVHMRTVPTATEVAVRVIARGTPGFSGADLANLVNEAALLAARRNMKVVGMRELEDAKDKVMMGAERRSMGMSEEEKRLTAYHEGGHALVSIHCSAADPIHKATIIPRGRALGLVQHLPESDRVSMSRAQLEARLTIGLAGRISEELVFGVDRVTTGASSDIQMVTDVARRMVTEWGYSDKLGPLAYGEPEQEVFLGHSVTMRKNVSESTAQTIDGEIRRLVDEAHVRARTILTEHMDDLNTLAKALLEYETLSGEEIRMLLAGEPLPPREPAPENVHPEKPPVSVALPGRRPGGGEEISS